MNVRKSNKRIDKKLMVIFCLFFVTRKLKTWTDLICALSLPSNLLAVGPTSCGKNVMAKKNWLKIGP